MLGWWAEEGAADLERTTNARRERPSEREIEWRSMLGVQHSHRHAKCLSVLTLLLSVDVWPAARRIETWRKTSWK